MFKKYFEDPRDILVSEDVYRGSKIVYSGSNDTVPDLQTLERFYRGSKDTVQRIERY